MLRHVRRLHEKVKGTLSQDAGVMPAGTPYSALDPALMLWTVAVIADSTQPAKRRSRAGGTRRPSTVSSARNAGG